MIFLVDVLGELVSLEEVYVRAYCNENSYHDLVKVLQDSLVVFSEEVPNGDNDYRPYHSTDDICYPKGGRSHATCSYDIW